ncbi:hypothetical protein TMLG_01444 [Mycobacterium tuberculosis SUMu012]|nr:hypothetical protein TMLG_01444 [Mycobacterium tuberculosis SUMu012]
MASPGLGQRSRIRLDQHAGHRQCGAQLDVAADTAGPGAPGHVGILLGLGDHTTAVLSLTRAIGVLIITVMVCWLFTPSPGTSEGPWLRTGDLGVIFEGELFITGRIKELLVVDGANHYPEDIEATIQEITGGRVVAIAVPDDRTEKLVTIIELMKRGRTDEEEKNRLRTVKREVASAISRSHRLRVADVVMVAPGSIPVTTSGKVRRSASVERYLHHEFSRLDAMA